MEQRFQLAPARIGQRHQPFGRVLAAGPDRSDLDRDRAAQKLDLAGVKGRPTYHLRLPDCRIDEADWSLALEWNRWVWVERIAEDAPLMDRLRSAWRDHRDTLLSTRGDWARRSRKLIEEAGH